MNVPADVSVEVTSVTVVLTWLAVPNATLYTVYRNGVSVDTTTNLTLTHTGAAGAATYEVSATVDSVETPKVAAANTQSNRVTLTWSAVAGASFYEILASGVRIGGTTGTSFSVVPDELHTAYRVTAYKDDSGKRTILKTGSVGVRMRPVSLVEPVTLGSV